MKEPQDLEEMMVGSTRCDFCGAEDPSYIYPTKSYVEKSPFDGKNLMSSGAFAACATCKSVVDSGSMKDLVDHAVREFFLRRPGLEEKLGRVGVRKVRREIAALYVGFKKARLGKPVAFG